MSDVMKIIAPLTVMDLNDPWIDDKLNVKALSSILTSAIENEIESCVISVNGKWGCGKSFFLQRWVQELTNNNWQALYFNAWEDDFIEDPLVALIGQLYAHFIENPKTSKCSNEIKGAMLNIASLVQTVAGEVAEHLTGVNVKEVARHTKYAFNMTVEDYQSLSKNRRLLREKLRALADKAREDTANDGHCNSPVVFVIDELDRCRPDFAVKVLERVKHLMNVPGIVFVFGIDREQLSATIKSVYGDIDAENYLRRFFDLDFKMPIPKIEDFVKYQLAVRNVKSSLEDLPSTDECVDNLNEFRQMFSALSKYHSLTLREIESACKVFIFVVRGYFRNNIMPPGVIAIMIFLKVREPDMYVRVMNRSVQPRELLEYLTGISNMDDPWAWKKLVFATYLICGEKLETNKFWRQLKSYCEGTTIYAAADKIFPIAFQRMSQEQRKLYFNEITGLESRGQVEYWNGFKTVDHVARVIDCFDVSAFAQ